MDSPDGSGSSGSIDLNVDYKFKKRQKLSENVDEVVNLDLTLNCRDSDGEGKLSGEFIAEMQGKNVIEITGDESSIEGRCTVKEKGMWKDVSEDCFFSLGLLGVEVVDPEVVRTENLVVAENVNDLPERENRENARYEVEQNGRLVEEKFDPVFVFEESFDEREPVFRIERNRAIPGEKAAQFAEFRSEECKEVKEEETDEESDEQNTEAEDWPGPFSTADKILRDRAEGVSCVFEKNEKSEVEINWIPSLKPKRDRVVTSLRGLCMNILLDNAEAIDSLEGVPCVLRHQIIFALCNSRKMSYHVFGLLANGRPTEICVADCSWASEERFQELFSKCNTEQLKVLKLDLSGHCMPDYILSSTFARSPKSLPTLTTVSFRGNYRLSDDGLNALACSAPLLSSVNLSQCSLLTSTGIVKLAETLEAVLRELVLDDCSNLDAMTILPALNKLEKLEMLSVSGIQSVKKMFVKGLLPIHGQNLKVLGLAGCRELSPSSVRIIGKYCVQLYDLDLRNLHKLNDNELAHLTGACRSLQKLKFEQNDYSDEAMAAFLAVSGNCLQELSLNNVKKVGHKTAIAISHHCSNLRKLDLSFCRGMTDKALGLIVDSCSSLKILKLFGCSQVTDVFLNGHSNPSIEIIGFEGSILKHLEEPEELCSM